MPWVYYQSVKQGYHSCKVTNELPFFNKVQSELRFLSRLFREKFVRDLKGFLFPCYIPFFRRLNGICF